MVHFTEMSYGRRVGLVIFGVITANQRLTRFRIALLTAGVTFGFQALKPILQEYGVYHDLCPHADKDPSPCKEQILRLNLMFAVASTCTNAFVLPIGMWLDYFGPKWTTAAGSIVFFLGNLLFAMSSPTFDAYIIGYALIAIGGPFMYMGIMHCTLAFPVKSGLIMAAITGAFDASSAMYEIFREFHNMAGGVTGWFTLKHFFYGYCAVPVVLGIVNLFLQPSSSLQWSAEGVDVAEEVTAVNPEEIPESEPLLGASEKEGPLGDRLGPRELEIQAMGFWQQLATPEFWLLSLSMLFYMCRVNFYISSAAEQLADISRHQPHPPNPVPGTPAEKLQLHRLIQFFNVALPIAGIVSIPPVGWLLDTYPLWVALTVLCVLLAVPFGILSLIANLNLQYVSMIFMVLLRPLMYTSANEVCSRTFGFVTFGKIYGLMMLIASIGNMLTYALNYHALQVDHGSYFHVNLFLTIVFPLVLVFPAYLAWVRRQVKYNAISVSEEGGGTLPISGDVDRRYGTTDETPSAPIGAPRRVGSRVESVAGSQSPASLASSLRNPKNLIRRYSTNQGGQF